MNDKWIQGEWNNLEHHGKSWDEECGKIILWKAVSIAKVKPPAKKP